MYKCAECGKECFFHRWYSSDDDGKVTATAANNPTYYMNVNDQFVPFCSCKCSNDYYNKNIKDADYVLEKGNQKTNYAIKT